MDHNLFGEAEVINSLRGRFGAAPPFSVLDARQGPWQARKREWLRLGIQSELGRGETATIGGSPLPLDRKKDKAASFKNQGAQSTFQKSKGKARCFGQDLMRGEHVVRKGYGAEDINAEYDEKTQKALGCYMAGGGSIEREQGNVTGTSIFDPVLCELLYKWFCPPGGAILDPFAGGSVRGIVAGVLGRRYIGVDLSPEQVKANRRQAEDIDPEVKPHWVVGDSMDLNNLVKGRYDFVFTCPPYHNLEVYSDDPDDLSTMTYDEFINAMRDIIMRSISRLKLNRFAAIVVGEIRDRDGKYRNFVGDTVQAFLNTGMEYLNEAILVTAVGSLPIRVGKQFSSGRKLGKTHQNILIFYKGNVRDVKKEHASLYEELF